MIFVSPRADATDYYVAVDYYSLSPNPVYIKTGDAVFWVDNDSMFAPFVITGGWGTVFTPYGIQFNVPPGTYNYTAESSFGGGGWSGSVVVQMNFPPNVKIANPTNGEVFTALAAFPFEADASDPNGDDIMDVEFWVNDTMVDDVYAPPYGTTVTNLSPGTYTLKAVAWDYSYVTATNSITITVVNPPPITLGGFSVADGKIVFAANGLGMGTTNVLEYSTNMVNWFPILTNISDGTPLSMTNNVTGSAQFFRLMQLQ